MQYQVSPFEHYLYRSDEPISGGFSLQASVRRSHTESQDKSIGGTLTHDSSSLFKFQSHIVPAGLVVEPRNPISYHHPQVIDGGVISEKLFNDLFGSVADIQHTKPRNLTKKKRT
jgi:hypothetical protein